LRQALIINTGILGHNLAHFDKPEWE